MKQLTVKDLVFSYDGKKNAVDNVNFEVRKGQYVSIIGHNGSGKSTMAKLLIGLLAANRGEISVDDLHLTEDTVYEVREKIAIVFQNPDNQFIGSTVRDDIAFGLENRSIEPSEMDEIIETYAAEVGMSDYLGHEPGKLSGGQKQRVAIAGALAMHPDILILDEATSMLDPRGKEEVNQLVHRLHTENKMTILSITHDIEEVIFSDYVIVMNEGNIALQGTPEEVLKQSDRLVRLQLDVPYSVKFNQAMKKKGIKLKNSFDLEGMVNELWEYNSKK
ncbi:energy-coupling factor transporter ATPase [Erysipelothrix urinaevulpis]|uniref:energy-coupling factor transporter ATPase n=1 Tax=Erysipelothrix urinaevulpis TaxID=2683717 RepID=UPI00135909D9|nr:energy-coupling factor transporter ATPase [Erysipelothrix urinaevulpis]